MRIVQKGSFAFGEERSPRCGGSAAGSFLPRGNMTPGLRLRGDHADRKFLTLPHIDKSEICCLNPQPEREMRAMEHFGRCRSQPRNASQVWQVEDAHPVDEGAGISTVIGKGQRDEPWLFQEQAA
jgi:hypothetical protein